MDKHKLFNLIDIYGRLNGLDDDEKALIMAMCIVESDLDEHAISSKKCKGLLQFADSTYKWMASQAGIQAKDMNVFDPEQHIMIGVRYFKYLRDVRDFKKHYPILIPMAWNWGEGNVKKYIGQDNLLDPAAVIYLPKETFKHVRAVYAEWLKIKRK